MPLQIPFWDIYWHFDMPSQIPFWDIYWHFDILLFHYKQLKQDVNILITILYIQIYILLIAVISISKQDILKNIKHYH
jgi:hypothetical protein